MGLLSVLLATAAGFATGAVWYMVLARAWLVSVGKTEDQVKADRNPLPFAVAVLGSLLTAGMMRHVFAMAGVEGIGAGLVSGLGIGAFMTAPWIVTNYAFAGRPGALWMIDAGHAILACGAIGAVLGAFA